MKSKMKLSDKTVFRIFNQVRKEYKFPPAVVEIHGDKTVPFYIRGMKVSICLEKIFDEKNLLAICRHELGHIEYAPQTPQNARRHLNSLKQMSGITETDILTTLLNVVYDLTIDTTVAKLHKNYIENLNPMVLEHIKRHGIPDNYYWRVIQGVYNCLLPKGLKIPVGQKYQKVARKIIEILRTKSSLDEQVLSITEELIFEALRESKIRNELIQFLLKITNFVTCEDFWKTEKKPDPGARKNSILGIFLKRPRSFRNARNTSVLSLTVLYI